MTVPMPRRKDWQQRLEAHFGACRRRAFEHGTRKHDCAQLAAGAVEAVTGYRPFADLEYSDAVSGLLALRRAGHGDHIAAARWLFPEIPAAEASIGDLAVVDGDGGPALAVVAGAGEVLFVARPVGIGVLPMSAAYAVLKV